MGSIGRNRGGLTKTLYQNLSYIGKDSRVIIALTGFQLDAYEILDELKEQGKIPQGTILRSMHEDISGRISIEKMKKTNSSNPGFLNSPNLYSISEEKRNGSLQKRYYSNGEYKGRVLYNSDGSTKYVYYHDDNRPQSVLYRDLVSANGYVFAREYLDDKFSIKYKIYYDYKEEAYLNYWVDTKGDPYKISSPSTKYNVLFSNIDGLKYKWGEELRKEFVGASFISNEPATMSALLGTRSETGRSVAAIHTVHYRNNNDIKDGHKPWMDYYVGDNTKGVHNLVVLTNHQRNDIKQEFPELEDKMIVISPPSPKTLPIKEKDIVAKSKTRHNIMYIGRLAPQKQVDQVIAAFKLACNKNKKIKLHIYGSGPEEKKLNKQVNKLKISDRVIFHGYTQDVGSAYDSCGIQLFATEFEGFGRVITEGFSHALPCVGYTSLYGPSELITKETGVPVRKNDVKGLSKGILKLVKDEELWTATSRGAYDLSKKYDKDEWNESWKKAILG